MEPPVNLRDVEERFRPMMENIMRGISNAADLLSTVRIMEFLRRIGLPVGVPQRGPTPSPTQYRPPGLRRSWDERLRNMGQ